jgi:hypothetical protein
METCEMKPRSGKGDELQSRPGQPIHLSAALEALEFRWPPLLLETARSV